MKGRKTQTLLNVDGATEDLRECVAAYRKLGLKTVGAMRVVAERCGMTHRRIMTLFYRDQTILVGDQERHTIALRAADCLDRFADEIAEIQSRARARAAAIRNREAQLTSQRGSEWQDSGTVSQRRAA